MKDGEIVKNVLAGNTQVIQGAPVFCKVGHIGRFKFATGGEAGLFLPSEFTSNF